MRRLFLLMASAAALGAYACGDDDSGAGSGVDAGGVDGGDVDAASPTGGDAAADADGGACAAGSFAWATAGGGKSEFDDVRGAAVDASGNVWLTGVFVGEATWGSASLTSLDKTHTTAFVAKLDPSGKVLLARALGNDRDVTDDVGARVRVDAAGHAYVAGRFKKSLNVDDVHLLQANSGVGTAAFVMAFDTDGKALWGAASANVGGSSEEAVDLAVDPAGNVVVTGSYTGQAKFGATVVTGTSTKSAVFVAKYSPGAKDWAWAKGYGGQTVSSGGTASALALTADGGSVYVGGRIGSDIDFDGDAIVEPLNTNASYLAKLDAATGTRLWAAQVQPTATSNMAVIRALAAGNDGSVYFTGDAVGSVQLLESVDAADAGTDAGAPITVGGSGAEMMVGKYTADGGPSWAKAPTGIAQGRDVRVDAAGAIYVGGYKQNMITFDPPTVTLAPLGQAFVARFDASGAATWASENAPTDPQAASIGWVNAVALAPDGALVVGGAFRAKTMFGSTTLTSAGVDDGYAARLCN